MLICLVHHADALGPHVDAQRPLSTPGQAQALRVAEAIRGHGFTADAIWHSGKLRARQTAEACWRIVNPLADFKMVRGLRPEDSAAIIRDTLLGDTRNLLLVGHMPHLPALLSLLVGSPEDFPLHGAVALQSDDGGETWREIWRVQGVKSA
jgi:phosphohistidine phosphatase